MEPYIDDDFLLSRGSQNTGNEQEEGTLNTTPRLDPIKLQKARTTDRSQTSSFANIVIAPSLDSDRQDAQVVNLQSVDAGHILVECFE